MRKALFLISMVLVLSSWMVNAQEIYRWVDEKGTVHFADDFTLVPEKYRGQVQQRKPPEKPIPDPARPPIKPEATGPTTGGPTPEKKDLLGRGEDWWRAKAKEWEDKLQNAQKNVDLANSEMRQKAKELVEARFKPDTIKRKLNTEMKDLEEKLKEREKERDEAKNMLENVLPKQAEDYKADPAWLKPKE